MLDSLTTDMSLALKAEEMRNFLVETEEFYEWSEVRNKFYCFNLSDFFDLGDTIQMTVKGLYKDSIIYVNNNPLMENKFEGYFFEGRDLYLTHDDKLDIYGLGCADTDKITYLDLGTPIQTTDSIATRWTISYSLDRERVKEHYTNDNLHYKIPAGAKDVNIVDGYVGQGLLTPSHNIPNCRPENLTYMVYSVGGMFIGKFNYAEICEFKQKEDINIVVALDSTGRKIYSIKLMKE